MIVPYSEMVSKAALSAPGCPSAVIEGHIRDSAIRTCERTHYWRAMLPNVRLEPGTWVYKFKGLPEGSEVFSLLSANLNDRNLPVVAPDVLICCFPNWSGDELTGTGGADALYNSPEYNEVVYNEVLGAVVVVDPDIDDGSSTPMAISRLSPCDYVVLPKPNYEPIYILRTYVALRPAKTAKGVDECIYRDLGDAIVHGALQELLLVPAAHWTNPDLAAYHAKQYLFKLTERRARANLGYSRGALVAHPQPFGI